MADKVKYNITVDFKQIMEKLHNVAKDNALKVRGDLMLENSIFDDETGELIHAGEYMIAVGQKDKTPFSPEDRNVCLKVIQEYVKYFVGEDFSKLIKVKDLQPLVEMVT